MDKGKLAVIGLFFVAFVGAAFVLAFMFRDVKGLAGSKDKLYVWFESVEGLREGDTVRVKGIESGTIADMSIMDKAHPTVAKDPNLQDKILVEIELYKPVGTMYMNHVIRIEESSLIGGKFLSVTPRKLGVSPEEASFDVPLPDDKNGKNAAYPLKGSSEPSGFKAINDWLQKNGSKFGDTFTKMEGLLDDIKRGTIGKVMTDEGALYNDVKTAANNAAKTFESAQEIMEKVRKGEGTIGKMVFEDKLYNDLQGLTDKARSIADRMDRGEGTLGKLSTDSKLYDDLADVMNSAKDLLNKMRTGEGTLGALINERELYDEMKETTANLRDITKKISNGQGMAGRIVNDEELGQDFKDAVREFKEMSANLNSVTKKLDKGEGTVGRLMSDDSLYRKADQAVDSLNKTLGSLASMKTMIGVEVRHFFETDVNQTMAFLDVYPAENKFLHIGGMSISVPEDSKNFTEAQLEDDGNENLLKIDAQLGYKFLDNKLTIRGGLLEGKPGAGIDFDFKAPVVNHDFRFTVEGRDAYNDVDDEDYDEKAGTIFNVEISSRVWKYLRLEAGVSRLGADAEFYTGFVFEWEDDDIRKLVGLLSAAK